MAPKQKGQKMDLGTFLTDTSLGSWADEMEDVPMPIRQMLHTTVDDTLEVETNLLKALVRTTALAIDPTAQHQEVMAVVELVKITHQAIRLQLR
ncbi:MAG: hypothetical protein L6R42_003575 [Xanthoria sp. 1 TBL-2021]|nr:MAG: hypothetical protein L6R42_003575 [Xanthoria sp. 1 TBL-2021]